MNCSQAFIHAIKFVSECVWIGKGGGRLFLYLCVYACVPFALCPDLFCRAVVLRDIRVRWECQSWWRRWGLTHPSDLSSHSSVCVCMCVCVWVHLCLNACGHVWKWAEESEKNTPRLSTVIRANTRFIFLSVGLRPFRGGLESDWNCTLIICI